MATRPKLLRSIVVASLPAAGVSSALFGLRVSSPAVVFLATLSLLPTKSLSPPSPFPVTPVVVQSRIPRRSLILTLLSLSALSFLLDGLAYVAYAVLNGVWRPGTGIELAALLGVIAYAALAAVGAYKDVNNVETWSRKRVKAAIFIALAIDAAQVVLLFLNAKARDPSHICDSSKLSKCIPDAFHFFTPLVRAVFLVPLLFALFSPRVVYVPADSPETAESAPLVQEDGNGPSVAESSKYGTFATQGQQPTASPLKASEIYAHMTSVCDIALFFQTESTIATLLRLAPFVTPAKGLILLITVFHVLTRLLTPLLPLSLGAAVNALLSSSSTSPIPMPLGNSPYTYILLFAALQFLTSAGGIPNLTKTLVSRLGTDADDVLSSYYIDHVLGLGLGSSKAKVVDDLHANVASGAASSVLHALSVLTAVIDDGLIGVIVLGLLLGWEFGVVVLAALGVYGYLICLNSRPALLASCPAKAPMFAFVQALFASGGLLLGSLYIAKGVTEGIWSAGAWVAWMWYWGILVLPLTWTPSLRAATIGLRSIFKVLGEPMGVVDGKNTIDGTHGVEVKFDNVSLTYPYTDSQAPLTTLTDVSFTLPASSFTAVVSTPGSSKSSILKALYRLYDVDSGSISVDNVPVHTLTLASLRSVVAVIPDICSEGRAKALSRALAKDAKVVLLEGSLERACVGGRTVLWDVGTGSLQGVESVDRILVLKDGQLVESGSFDELVQAEGLFASLWANHLGAVVPVPGSSSVTAASGVAEGYDVSITNPRTESQAGEVIADASLSDSPQVATTLIRAASVRAPTASIRATSIKPTASIKADSVAPSIPPKEFPAAISFPASAPEESEPLAFPTSSPSVPIAFPKTDDSRSIDSASQAHVRLPTSITFDTTATPPRVSTPDPTGASSSSPTPEAEGKRKRISSQNFQRLARRISLSTPRKGAGIQGIPGIAGIAGVLRRDTVKSDKANGETSGRDSTEVPGGSASAPETARNSGEMTAERIDKEKEEKKRKRKSFMEVVGARRGDSSAAGTPAVADAEPQVSNADDA